MAMYGVGMSYTIKLYGADDASDFEKQQAQARFRKVLEETLGDAALVAPVYVAYRRIVGTYGEQPDLEMLTDAERAIFEQWQAAETAAVAAAFGTHRYMGDADYEIVVS
jgi:hypothetical protein